MSLRDTLVPAWEPGTSWLHKLGAGSKLVSLLVAGSVLLVFDQLPVQLLGAGLVVVLYHVSGIGVVSLKRLVLAWKWLLLALWLVHVGFSLLDSNRSWQVFMDATAITVRLATLMAWAALITRTTRTTALIDVLIRLLRPLQPLGLPVERIGLMLGLTLRYIPLLASQYDELQEAHYARGIKAGLSTSVVPLLVHSLRQSDELAEAIEARCFGCEITSSSATRR